MNPRTGWGRAAIGLSKWFIDNKFDVFFYPTHNSRAKVIDSIRPLAEWEFDTLRDTDFFQIIITFDLPDKWRNYRYAISVGYFFWESGSFPKNFVKQFENVDQVWVPSDWQKRLILKYSKNSRVFKIPIPPHIKGMLGGASTVPSKVENDYVLWMGTLEPRKGLRLFLKEWSSYKKNGGSLSLKLKVSSNNVSHSPTDISETVKSLISSIHAFSFPQYSIEGIFHDLSEVEVSNLYMNARSIVGSSFGEGFGYVAADGILRNIPVFWPSNTAMSDWMPPSSEGAIDCYPYTSFLKNDQEIYQNPIWYPPREGGIESALWKSEYLTENESEGMSRVQNSNFYSYLESSEIAFALKGINQRVKGKDKR